MGAPNEGQAAVQVNLLELLENISEDDYVNATIVLEEEGVFKENEITNVLAEAKAKASQLPFDTQTRIKQMFCDGKFVNQEEYGEEEVQPADDTCQKPEEKEEGQAEQEAVADQP